MFITLTNKGDGKSVCINMNLVESFALSDDHAGGTKLFSTLKADERDSDRSYWRVEETPDEIRQLMNQGHVVNVVNSAVRKPVVTTPIEYKLDGRTYTEGDIVNALRMMSSVRPYSPSSEHYNDWIDQTFRWNCRHYTGNYEVSPGDALVIARIIRQYEQRIQTQSVADKLREQTKASRDTERLDAMEKYVREHNMGVGFHTVGMPNSDGMSVRMNGHAYKDLRTALNSLPS